MIKLIFKSLGLVLLIHVLALIGLMLYGLGTGRFSEEKIQQYLATWKGHKLVPPPPVVNEEETAESPSDATARISTNEIQKEILTREIQRQIEQMNNMKYTVDLARKKLDTDLLELKQKQESFQQTVKTNNEQAQDVGFLKTVASYSSMKPKMVKNDFMNMDDKEVVRYLSVMKQDVVTKVLNQFKTDDEQAKRVRVLRMLQEKEPDENIQTAKN